MGDGGGGGGGAPPWNMMISGQTGGRIIPGTHYGLTTIGTGTTQVWDTTETLVTIDLFDYRAAKVIAITGRGGAPGGGAGQPGLPGFDVNFTAGAFTEPTDGMLSRNSSNYTNRSIAGTGGGWGAKGGDQYLTGAGLGLATLTGITVGGAGGKAVNTSGFSVTWLGGQDRAYGVVG
jgi:hypothetical protein